jgi:RNA polymerase sporulation-specific sigma factor
MTTKYQMQTHPHQKHLEWQELNQLAYQAKTDPIAWEKLQTNFAPILHNKPHKNLKLYSISHEDIYQELVIGLWRAVVKFDPDMPNASFVSLAQFFIHSTYCDILTKYNRVYNKINREALSNQYAHLAPQAAEKEEVGDYIETKPDDNIDLLADMLSNENYNLIYSQVEPYLTDLEIEVLHVFLDTDNSQSDAANQLGVDPRVVDNAMQRIRAKFKQINYKDLIEDIQEPPINSDINSLTDGFREKIEELLKIMTAQGFDPVIYEALRSNDRQRWLYGIGRTHSLDTKPITWYLHSQHLTGNAVDITSASKGWAWLDFYKALGHEARELGLATITRDKSHVQGVGL